jgi:hypothetical protein
MSGAFNLFGADDPQDAAEPWLNKIPGMLNGIYNPWINAGMGALNGMNQYEQRGNAAGGMLQGQYNQMINDPSGLINKLGSGFQQSPGYAFQTSQELGAANRAAAAGGMAGSPMEQQQIAGVTNQLANQDYYNYLNHSENLYGQGINGLQRTEGLGLNAGEDVFNQGAAAAHDLASGLGSAYMSQANLGYQGTINRNQRIGGAIGAIGNFFDPGGAYLNKGGSGGGGGGGGLGSFFGGSSSMGSQNGGMQGGDNNGELPQPFSGGNNGWGSSSGGGGGGGGSGMDLGALASLAMMLF